MRSIETKDGGWLIKFFLEIPADSKEIEIRNEVMKKSPDKAFLPVVYYADNEWRILSLTLVNAVLAYKDQWEAGNVKGVPEENFFVLDLPQYTKTGKLYDLKTQKEVRPNEIKLSNGHSLSNLMEIAGVESVGKLFVRDSEKTSRAVGLGYFSVWIDEIIIQNNKPMAILTTRDRTTWSDDNQMTWVAGRTRFGNIILEMVEEWLEERIRWKISGEGEITFLVPQIKNVFPDINLNEEKIKNIILNALKSFIKEKLTQVDEQDFETLFGMSKEKFEQIFSNLSSEKIKIEFFEVKPIQIIKDKGKGIDGYALRDIIIDGKEIKNMPTYYDRRTTGWEIRQQVELPDYILEYPPLFSESATQIVEAVPINELSKINVVPYVWILGKYPMFITLLALVNSLFSTKAA